jgi:hypothetical protein
MTAIPSARLSVWYRIPLALLYLATAGVAGPARFTPADATVASPSPEPCQYNELDVSSPINPVATVYAPGQVGTENATLQNPVPLRCSIDGRVEPESVRGQIARARAANATDTRVAGGASTASS